jgi:outer membrane protein assembly factor BamD
MRNVSALLLLGLGAISLIPGQARAAVDYTPDTGWTVEDSSGAAAAEATASAQLARAQQYEKDGDYHRAMLAYEILTRKFPRSGAAADAQIKAGDMAVQSGDFDLGYQYYNEYLTKYPKGDSFDQALQGMYNVGQKYLDGARRKLFGVKTFPSMVRAQQIFENIVKVAPFSKWAPLAQFYAGQALEKRGQNDDAIAAYQEVISRYPSDPAAADAQYQIGYVYLVESRTAYDESAAVKAQDAFDDFLARYPTSEKAAQAQDNLKAITAHGNSNTIIVAKYYDKKKDYKAAVIYYNEVIKENPGSPDAKFAQDRIAALRAKVGDPALAPGPEKPETPQKAQEARKMQAQIDTSNRADYDGPPVAQPTPTPEQAPSSPPMRSSPDDLNPPAPNVEPALPSQ